MTLGAQIALLRKQKNITQEALAQRLGVTNQAVSKWESEQCCPDVTLLPKLADIFGISMDELFGRSAPGNQSKLPEDGTLRIVLFQGNHRLTDQELCKDVTIHWEGTVGDLRSVELPGGILYQNLGVPVLNIPPEIHLHHTVSFVFGPLNRRRRGKGGDRVQNHQQRHNHGW